MTCQPRPDSRWIVAVAMLLPGCGDGLVPASGVVSLDGGPVAGATVTFIPTGPGIPASGTTDATGRFELAIGSGRQGLPRGRYRVTITKLRVSGPQAGEAQRGAALAAGTSETEATPDGLLQVIEHVLPARYADAATSGLEADVSSADEHEFTLRTDP